MYEPGRVGGTLISAAEIRGGKMAPEISNAGSIAPLKGANILETPRLQFQIAKSSGFKQIMKE